MIIIRRARVRAHASERVGSPGDRGLTWVDILVVEVVHGAVREVEVELPPDRDRDQLRAQPERLLPPVEVKSSSSDELAGALSFGAIARAMCVATNLVPELSSPKTNTHRCGESSGALGRPLLSLYSPWTRTPVDAVGA